MKRPWQETHPTGARDLGAGLRKAQQLAPQAPPRRVRAWRMWACLRTGAPLTDAIVFYTEDAARSWARERPEFEFFPVRMTKEQA